VGYQRFVRRSPIWRRADRRVSEGAGLGSAETVGASLGVDLGWDDGIELDPALGWDDGSSDALSASLGTEVGSPLAEGRPLGAALTDGALLGPALGRDDGSDVGQSELVGVSDSVELGAALVDGEAETLGFALGWEVGQSETEGFKLGLSLGTALDEGASDGAAFGCDDDCAVGIELPDGARGSACSTSTAHHWAAHCWAPRWPAGAR